METIAINPSPHVRRFYFEPSRLSPNSIWPVILYQNAVEFNEASLETAKLEIASIASTNGWYLDWDGSIYRRRHYHSTAHEALIVFSGRAVLELGGAGVLTVVEGNIIIIPAGVSHQRISSTDDFTVFGLYPEGQKWDLQWAWRKNYANSCRRIKKVPKPEKDPIFGESW